MLSGGSGTRLWPLSTSEVPKQFAALLGEKTLFGLTLERLDGMAGLRPPIVVTGKDHQQMIQDAVSVAGLNDVCVIVEPAGRNTAPAVIAAALVADPADVLVILPSDHLIADVPGFQGAVRTAVEVADSGGIVVFGVQPTRPETGYGYIEVGRAVGPASVVDQFKEKPDAEKARELAGDGQHLWNSGMFIVRADAVLEEARLHQPEVLDGVESALTTQTRGTIDLAESFASVEAISFDVAIMEKTDRAVVVPLDVGWNDIGSFRSLLDVSPQDALGNHLLGDVDVLDVHGSFIRANSRRVVVAGVSEMIVVETPDVVMILPLDRAQEVRDLQSLSGEE